MTECNVFIIAIALSGDRNTVRAAPARKPRAIDNQRPEPFETFARALCIRCWSTTILPRETQGNRYNSKTKECRHLWRTCRFIWSTGTVRGEFYLHIVRVDNIEKCACD